MSQPHFSPTFSLPSFRNKIQNTTTWGSGGNTCTVNDQYIFGNSDVHVYVTGSTPPKGNWSVTITPGQFVVTSTDPENSTLPIAYVIL